MAQIDVGVIGAGAWGTALALVAARAGHAVKLWGHDAARTAAMQAARENVARLPGVRLEPAIVATSDLKSLCPCDVIIVATPAQRVREVIGAFAKLNPRAVPAIIAAKGIEHDTGLFMTQVLTQTWPQATPAVISGPGFASDVAGDLPTALTLACADEVLGQQLAQTIGYRQLRLYWTRDMTGVELGGAVKNVLAIAAGIVDGRGLGKSALAALITRGFAEMTRLGVALGARPETLAGLSGLGDLVLTCSSPLSRNMSLGRELGRGISLADALAARTAVTEGVATAAAVIRIAREHGIEMPIAEAVFGIVESQLDVESAIAGLLARPFRAEG
jgi:glycerol-3-phosphate dehydrogenase (NAD(P)+)